MRVRANSAYVLAFFCLAAILGIGHELAHHATGYLICGAWGYKTFNSFSSPRGASRITRYFWLAPLAVLCCSTTYRCGLLLADAPTDVGSKLFGLTLMFATFRSCASCSAWLHANDEPG